MGLSAALKVAAIMKSLASWIEPMLLFIIFVFASVEVVLAALIIEKEVEFYWGVSKPDALIIVGWFDFTQEEEEGLFTKWKALLLLKFVVFAPVKHPRSLLFMRCVELLRNLNALLLWLLLVMEITGDCFAFKPLPITGDPPRNRQNPMLYPTVLELVYFCVGVLLLFLNKEVVAMLFSLGSHWL